MHPGIVRHLISPALERILGRRTFAVARQLADSQTWSSQQLRSWQEQRLAHRLADANDHCPWWRETFAQVNVDPHNDRPFDALAKLPLLDKTAIRRNLDVMCDPQAPGGLIPFNTGGSSGNPLVFYVDRDRIAADKAARMLTHAWFNAEHGQNEVYLWGAPVELSRQDRLKYLRDHLTNETLLEAFNLTPDRCREYLQRIDAIDPVSVFGYPSSLALLAEFALAEGLKFNGSRLQAVFVTGEVCDNRHRRVLREFFRAPVADCYGSRDGGFIAHECTAGNLHVVDPTHIVEILDEDGRPCAPGATGEIVITHLEASAVPLIRYRTGDMGSLLDNACTCGLTWRCMGPVQGRMTDQLVGADGSVKHALSAIYILRTDPAIAAFRIHQQADRSLDVLVVPEAKASIREDSIRDGLQRHLGQLPVRISCVADIPALPSGKYRYVLSEARSELLARPPRCEAESSPAGVNSHKKVPVPL